MERVQGKEGGRQSSAPESTGQLAQEGKEQNGIGSMEQEAGQVMAGGFQAVELAIEQDGKPGQRMPEAGLQIGEGPLDALPAQSAAHVRVFGHVNLVVEVDKSMAANRPVRSQSGDKQNQRNKPGVGKQTQKGRLSGLKFIFALGCHRR